MKYAFVLAGATMLFAGAACEARAQESIQVAKQRWKQLTPDERRALEDRFKKLQQLTPEERAALKNRHEVLQRMRHDDDAEDGAREPKKQPRPRRMDERIFKKLEKLSREGGGAKREAMRAQLRGRVEDELMRMEEAGVLVQGEAERLVALPPQELAAALRTKMKEFFFRNPPPRFAQLPEAERARLANLPPEQFGREIRKALGKSGGEPKAERFDQDDQAAPPRRPFLPKETFERFLTPAQMAQLESLDKKDRRAQAMRFLTEHARARLVERGEDPRVLDELKDLPPFERQLRVVKILDPSFTPPDPPQRAKGNGQGQPRGKRDI